MATEKEDALVLAEEVLDTTLDPDDDMTVLARQFIRATERADIYKKERDAIVQSCYYRTRGGKVYWKQGNSCGVSIADDTEPEAFLEAINAIRHNAGLLPES